MGRAADVGARLRHRPDRSNGVVARLFGARDLLLGTALLVADDKQLVPAAQLGAAADMLDVLATGIEYRGGRASNWTLVSVGAGAATFAALGVLLIRNAEGHEQAGPSATQR